MKLSLCLIVKNEEKKIKKCIESVKTIVNEIIVVDTGSDDNTVSVVKDLGAKVYYYKWNKDFSAARNYALKKAKGDWIIFLDSDEYVSEESLKYIKNIIDESEIMKCNSILIESININEDTNTIQSKLNIIKIFKNNSNLRYKGKIHEKIFNSNGNLQVMDGSEYIKVFHTGYSSSTLKEKNKAGRNIELLYEELDNNKNDSNIYFYLVESLLINNEIDKAYEYCDEVFRCGNGSVTGIYEKTYVHKLSILMHNNEDEKKICDTYKKAIEVNEFYPDFDAKMQIYYYSKNEYEKALEYSKRCIEKMNNYDQPIESWIMPKARDVYVMTGNIYDLLGLKRDSLQIWINILKFYKEDEYSLYKLLNIFKENESKEEILDFLKKIFDINNPKEKLTIIRAAIRTEDLELSKYLTNELS